jgi:hypothetical protein
MSVQWMDDFKRYGSTAGPPASHDYMLDGTPWIDHGSSASINRLLEDPDPSATGMVYKVMASPATSNFGDTSRLSLPTPAKKIGIALRVWLASLPANGSLSKSIQFLSTSNGMLYHLSIRPNGSIRFYRGTTFSGRTLVDDTVSPVLFANSWNHLEFWLDTTSGEYWLYKEGVAVASLTGTDSSPLDTNIGIIGFADSEPGASNDPVFYIKSLIVADGNGTEINSEGSIGPVSLYYQDVISDVSGAWSPSTGSDMFAVLDKETPDDTTYLSADDSPPEAAVFELEDLPADIVGIRAVMMVGRMRKSDGGDAQVQMSVLSNGDADSGSDRAVATAFTYYWDISELDPDTAAAWTPTAFNSATFKLDRTL